VAHLALLRPSHPSLPPLLSSSFFFNDPATTHIYTLSLHDALPISRHDVHHVAVSLDDHEVAHLHAAEIADAPDIVAREVHEHDRSEEHTSELQSLTNLVCRLLLEKKKKSEIRTTSCTVVTSQAGPA